MASVISLPNELVTEIMSRVPGKSIARFRSVSKELRYLLSDPCFLRLHHNRSLDSLFTLTARPKYYDPICQRLFGTTGCNLSVTNKADALVHEFMFEFEMGRIRMLSCYHQLLCFVCETGIHLCDPVNKGSKKLPKSLLSPSCFNESNECLVSFGFVDATKQYKVVKWPEDLDENRTRRLPSGLITTWKKVNLKFEVLNIDIVEDGRLKVSRWRRQQRPCPYLLQLSSQVHVNGFIYWTTSDFQIVSFSLQDETFSTLNLKPPFFHLDTQGSQKSPFFTLFGSRGNLYMTDYDASSQIMEIWRIEESAWAMIHKIDLGGTHPNKNPRSKIHNKIIDLGGTHPNKNDGKVEMLDIRSDQVLFKLSSTMLLLRYDAKTNILEDCGYCGIVSQEYQLCHSTDGLLSLHNIK